MNQYPPPNRGGPQPGTFYAAQGLQNAGFATNPGFGAQGPQFASQQMIGQTHQSLLLAPRPIQQPSLPLSQGFPSQSQPQSIASFGSLMPSGFAQQSPMDLKRSVSAVVGHTVPEYPLSQTDFIESSDLKRFEALFLSSSAGQSQLSGISCLSSIFIDISSALAARNIFVQSGLPDEVLARVWDVCSVLKNPSLSFPEFCLAMFLITKRATAGIEIPSELPPNIRAAVLAGTTPTASSDRQSTVPQLQMQHQQPQPGRGPAPAVPQSFSGGFGSTREDTTWAISPQEKAEYDAVFRTWDPSNTGYISGDRARQIFMQSNLHEDILGHIWNLADSQASGKLDSNEFAVAMHLIHAKRKGRDLPKTLPPNLVPPSTRALDSITSTMKNQVMNDISSKRPGGGSRSLFGNGASADDPLGLSGNGSRSSLAQRTATKEEREEERKIRAAELELKKKELAIVSNRVDAATTAFAEMTNGIETAKREAINAHDDLIHSIDSRETLLDQIRGMIPDAANAAGEGLGPASISAAE
ncbi:hypothetical protein HDU82_001239, partial [Entophlyctis luteolus]